MTGVKKKICWWHIVLLAVTILAAVPKIWIGMEQDESYIVTMGIRLLNGDRLFAEMWELHMTSAWPAFLGLAIYQAITGTLEGSLIFLRILSTLFQFSVGLLAYSIFKKYVSRDAAVLAGFFVANFLPRATQNLEYGLLEMLFVLIAVLLLYDELMRRNAGEKENWLPVIAAGVMYALGVLAYPTIILSFPVLLAALYLLQERPQQGKSEGGNISAEQAGQESSLPERKAGRWKLPLAFAIVCGICAVAFLLYVLSYLSPEEFLASVQGVLADGTHSDIPKTQTYLAQLVELLKRTVMIGAVAVTGWLIYRRWEKDRRLLWYGMVMAGAVIFVGFNVTGLRPSGPIGLQIRYILAAAAGIYFMWKMRDKMVAGLFLLPGLAIYVGAMIGSNMGFEENASFLYLAVLAAVVLMAEYAGKQSVSFARAGIFCVAVFIFGLMFGKGYLVRIKGTGPANITEERIQLTEGVLRGIYVYPEDARMYEAKAAEMQAYSDDEDVVLYLGGDALCNTFSEGAFTSATCISTPVYNEEWVLYYENAKHPEPTILFIDKGTLASVSDFLETEYGAWLRQRYILSEEDFVEEEAFYILRLKEN